MLASEVAPQRLLVERCVAAEVANVITDFFVDGSNVGFQGLEKGSEFAWFVTLRKNIRLRYLTCLLCVAYSQRSQAKSLDFSCTDFVWISSGLDLVDVAVDAKVIPGSVRGEGTLGVEGKDKIYSLKTKAWPIDPAFG